MVFGVNEQKLPAFVPRAGTPAAAPSKRIFNLCLLLLILACAGYLRFTSGSTDDQEQASDFGKSRSRRRSSFHGMGLTNEAEAQDPRVTASDKGQQLNIQYASHLIKQSDDRALNYDVKSSNVTATLVMGRMSSDENHVKWVERLHDIDDMQIYVVDNPDTQGPHLERNHGREAAVYLSYIIANYDKLNDITFFWHNDEEVWHNNLLLGWNSVQTINRMDRQNILRSGYVPARCDHWPGCPLWVRFNPSKAEHRLDPHRLEEMFTREFFTRLFPETIDFPPYFSGTCCSQFAVSRDQIRSRPVETYQRIFDWIMEYESDDRSGMVMEYMWPYIFTRRGSMCPSMEECYCKTYNFCLRNPADVEALDHWNQVRTRREEVKWQLTFMEEALETAQQAAEQRNATGVEVVGIEEKLYPEIERLNEDLEVLTNNTWSSREAIIHRWKLPAPPVGW